MADGQDDVAQNSISGPVHGSVVRADHVHRDLVVHHHGQRPDETRELAALIERAERPALNQLLGDQAASPVADTPFAQLPVELVSWRTDGGDEDGSLREIANYYRGLEHGRLVVTGEAGGGKTVLLLKLLLDLLDGDAPRRVPVRLSLPTFNPGVALGDLRYAETADLAARLDSWIVTQLHTSFGLSKQAARELVRNDQVLPVLDGLDEMDPDDAEPALADAVVRALNRRPVPVVVACRSSRYRHLSSPLQTATVIAVQPLTPDAVADYLTARFPCARTHWRPILDRLKCDDDALATALCSPLRLYLAATAYQNGDPAELLKLTTHEEIDQHLLDRFVPAVTDANPRYHPADVHRWLVSLARVMDGNAGRGRSGSDLAVIDVWWASGRLLPRLLGALPMALVTIISPLVLYLGYGWIDGALVTAVAFTAVMVIGIRTEHQVLCTSVRVVVSRRHWKLFGPTLLTSASGSIFIFTLICFFDGLGPAFGMTSVLLVGMSVLAVRWLPEVVPRPGMFVRRALQSELAAVTTVVGMASVTLATMEGHKAAGLISFASLMCVLVRSPWYTYFAAIVLAANRAALPWRPARFLDWALDVGLLRTSGTALQFRHREFQRHLLR